MKVFINIVSQKRVSLSIYLVFLLGFLVTFTSVSAEDISDELEDETTLFDAPRETPSQIIKLDGAEQPSKEDVKENAEIEKVPATESEAVKAVESTSDKDTANKESTAKKEDSKQDQGNSGFKKAFSEGESNGPLFIKSDTLTLDSKERIFTYKGNVRVVRDNMEITTDLMIGRYAESQDLESILCVGNVVITKGEDMRATSNRAFYNVVAAKIELTDEPELARDGNVLSADKIIIFVDEDRSEAEGNVRVKVIKTDEGGGGSGGKMKGILGKKSEESGE